MKKFNWITAFIISYVTCGIYALYMWYVMSEDGNKMAEKSNAQKNTSFIVAVLLGAVTCGIYLIYWMYKFYNQQVAIAKAHGVAVQPVDNPIILVILTCVPVYSYYMLCGIYNNNVDACAE